MYIRFQEFLEKVHLQSFNMSEVIDSEKYGYLNALKLLFQDTFSKSTY